MVLEAAVHTNDSPSNCFPVMKHGEPLISWKKKIKGSFLIVKIQVRFFSIDFFSFKNRNNFFSNNI